MKNVKKSGRGKNATWTVQSPNGKTKVYKTERGAIAAAERMAVHIAIPQIVTANTYFWTPSGNAPGRRSAENRRNAEINDFATRFSGVPGINVTGKYSETCGNVYKSMEYVVDGRTTNLTGLIGAAAKWGIILDK